jgi:hypothetical protein
MEKVFYKKNVERMKKEWFDFIWREFLFLSNLEQENYYNFSIYFPFKTAPYKLQKKKKTAPI